jgi:hypothetical protein
LCICRGSGISRTWPSVQLAKLRTSRSSHSPNAGRQCERRVCILLYSSLGAIDHMSAPQHAKERHSSLIILTVPFQGIVLHWARPSCACVWFVHRKGLCGACVHIYLRSMRANSIPHSAPYAFASSAEGMRDLGCCVILIVMNDNVPDA